MYLKIIYKHRILSDTFIFRFKPIHNRKLTFIAGQYVNLINPKYSFDKHSFSIASSPSCSYLEFCIKVYGNWTKEMSRLNIGDIVELEGPYGSFIWDQNISNAVFLLGGIGISPVMSMLRFIESSKQSPSILIFYGNKTPQTVVYKNDLKKLQKKLNLNVIDIFSEISSTQAITKHIGFIDENILRQYIDFKVKQTFFYIGPPLFTKKMKLLLNNLQISNECIKSEQLI